MPLIATSSYSFDRLAKTGDAALVDTPRLARECGAGAIEFALGGQLSPPLDPALARDLLRACEDAGLPCCGVCIASDLLNGDEAQRRTAIDAVHRQLDAAAILAIRRFRFDLTMGPQGGDFSDDAFTRALPLLINAARPVIEHAAALGIVASFENHGRFIQHHERILRLLRELQHPSFGLTLDLGNLLFASQDVFRAVEALAPHAVTIHVKDFQIDPADATPEELWVAFDGGPKVRACAIGEGDVPIDEAVTTIRSMDFRGPWVIEFEGLRDDPRTAVRRGVESLRKSAGLQPPSPKAS